jgi:hypothetical protein
MVIGHEISIEPVQHFGAVFLPELEIAGKANALGCDIGARLFEPERETAEFFGKLPPRELSSGAPSRRPWVRSSRKAVASAMSRTSSGNISTAAEKFAMRPVISTRPPKSFGKSFSTAEAAFRDRCGLSIARAGEGGMERLHKTLPPFEEGAEGGKRQVVGFSKNFRRPIFICNSTTQFPGCRRTRCNGALAPAHE